MKNNNPIFRLLLILCLAALISCHGEKSKSVVAKEEEKLPEDIVELRDDQIKLANVQLGAIELRTLNNILKVSGFVAIGPQNQATVCEPLGGFVKSISQMPGYNVRKGQILAVLENQEFVDIQQNYLEAKSRLEFAEADFKRHKELFLDDVYSEKTVQQTTAEYKSLKSQVKALEQKMLMIGINPETLNADNISGSVAVKSPINGFITKVNINIGKYVSPEDILFEIINNDNLFLELTLFDKDADKVSIGQRISFYINNETERHEAVIYQTGKSISEDKTYRIFANVTSTCEKVLPGMYVNALIEKPGDLVTALPSDAIVSFNDIDYIFVFSKNKEENGKPFTEYRMVQVKKGITDGGYTEVALPKELDTVNLKVVVNGAYTLLSAKKNAGEMAC
jgi:membrane fusion protein, heavy metal efflux system